MRSITLRPGESITIGDTVISAEHSDLKSGSAAARTSAIGGGYIGIHGLSLRGLVRPGEPVSGFVMSNDRTQQSGAGALLAFLNGRSVERQEAFAAACDTTVGYLRQVAYGNRQCSASLAIAIDRESAGRVPFEDLCPDADWAYVRSRDSDRPGKADAQISNRAFPVLDDLRPILNEILRTGIRKADVARRLGVERATITDASRPSDRPWMPTYANGVRLMQLHREVCGGEGGDA
ncbi:MAG: helix-turn-helix domain-containing protein [Castellaniella sp.]|nr:helix-turn-helix domain-containing protein [Castellaniella sp.]